MGLMQDIKDLEKQIAEENGDEVKDEEQDNTGDSDGSQEDGEEQSGNEDNAEESGEDDQKQPEKMVESIPSSSEMARSRILEKKNRELEDELKRLKETPQEKLEVREDVEPNKQEDYEGWLEWKNAKLEQQITGISEKVSAFEKTTQEKQQQEQLSSDISQGFQELKSYADKAQREDFADAMEHVGSNIARSMKILYPSATPEQIKQSVQFHVLQLAGGYESQNLNPAEAPYKMAQDEFGYTKQDKEDTKVNLDNITKAKQRSAAPVGGKTKKEGMSEQEARKLTTAQAGKLSDAEVAKILAEAG